MKKIIVFTLLSLVCFFYNISYANDVYLPNQWYTKEKSNMFFKYVTVHDSNNINYYKYINGRFLFSVFIPKSFSMAYSPVNDDGCQFYLPDKSASITVTGSHNCFSTLNDYFILAMKNIEISNVIFINHNNNWFVISWVKDNKIHYQKTFVSSKYENTLKIVYPSNQKKDFSKIVSIVTKSFTAGW